MRKGTATVLTEEKGSGVLFCEDPAIREVQPASNEDSG
jgi:hypothetical protein